MLWRKPVDHSEAIEALAASIRYAAHRHAKAMIRVAKIEAAASGYAARVASGLVRAKEKAPEQVAPDEWVTMLANPEIPAVEREDLLDAMMKLSGRVKADDAARLAAANFYEPRRLAYGLPEFDGRDSL